jgi:hypothetical protein
VATFPSLKGGPSPAPPQKVIRCGLERIRRCLSCKLRREHLQVGAPQDALLLRE